MGHNRSQHHILCKDRRTPHLAVHTSKPSAHGPRKLAEVHLVVVYDTCLMQLILDRLYAQACMRNIQTPTATL